MELLFSLSYLFRLEKGFPLLESSLAALLPFTGKEKLLNCIPTGGEFKIVAVDSNS